MVQHEACLADHVGGLRCLPVSPLPCSPKGTSGVIAPSYQGVAKDGSPSRNSASFVFEFVCNHHVLCFVSRVTMLQDVVDTASLSALRFVLW